MNGISSRHRNQSSACPICGGHELRPRGTGTRCFGYSTEKTIYCTRVESKTWHSEAGVWSHRRDGQCDCGYTHGNPVQRPLNPRMPGITRNPREDALEEPANRARSVEQASAVYEYHSEDGSPLMRVLRFEKPKEFRQQRWSESGWVWGLGDRDERPDPVLFGLPAVRAACEAQGTVWLVEGEKDALSLAEHGVFPVEQWATGVTCNAGGSSQWTHHHAVQLRGAAHIKIIRDKDEAGRKWSSRVLETLLGGEFEEDQIEAYEVPCDKPGADWSDLLEDGGNLDDLVLVWPTPVETQKLAIRTPVEIPKELNRLDIINMDKPPAIHWPSEIEKCPQFSGLTILSGDSGTFKTWVALASSLQAAKAGVEVLFISVELSPALIWQRLMIYFSGNGASIPEKWGFYQPKAHEPWENVLDAIEDRCTGEPIVVFIDSINTLAANEQAPTDRDTYQLGIVSERMMWARNAVGRAKGLLGVCLISESNASGEMKGRFTFRADIAVNMEKDKSDFNLVDITVNKNWGGFSGPLGTYEFDKDNGRLKWVAGENKEVEM